MYAYAPRTRRCPRPPSGRRCRTCWSGVFACSVYGLQDKEDSLINPLTTYLDLAHAAAMLGLRLAVGCHYPGEDRRRRSGCKAARRCTACGCVNLRKKRVCSASRRRQPLPRCDIPLWQPRPSAAAPIANPAITRLFPPVPSPALALNWSRASTGLPTTVLRSAGPQQPRPRGPRVRTPLGPPTAKALSARPSTAAALQM